jgi:hypothetical protein
MIKVLDQEGNPRQVFLSSPKCKIVVSKPGLRKVTFNGADYVSVGPPVKIDVDLSKGKDWTVIHKFLKADVACEGDGFACGPPEGVVVIVARPSPRFKLSSGEDAPVLDGKPVLKAGPASLLLEFDVPLKGPPLVDIMSGTVAILRGLKSEDKGEGKYSLQFTVPKDAKEGLAFAVPHGVEQDGHRF